jgi:hypothetical protein
MMSSGYFQDCGIVTDTKFYAVDRIAGRGNRGLPLNLLNQLKLFHLTYQVATVPD